MQSICLDKTKRLVVKFEPTGNSGEDYFTVDFLNESDFTRIENNFFYESDDIVEFKKRVKWTVDKFVKDFEGNLEICDSVNEYLDSINTDKDSYENALTLGKEIKEKSIHNPNISEKFIRKLMPYQKESVEHLMEMGNGANFSVPGSGKTTITYASISRWKEDGTAQKIIVIGPTASFLPWEEEYVECFGETPRSCRVSGDLASKFHELGDSFDLFLMHFNTAMNRQWELQNFMQKWNTVLIIDESHYIKSPALKRWASTAINVAPYAKHRIILSGTPMPNNAKDLWTQITFLWPQHHPLGNQIIYNNYVKKHGLGDYQPVLDSLFCRIKKNTLNLPEPKWITHKLELNSRQQDIYNVIEADTLKEINETNIQDQAKLQKFRIAKMVRLLQTASNPTLLYELTSGFDVSNDLFSEQFGMPKPSGGTTSTLEPTTVEKILNYSRFEIPSKMMKAAQIAGNLYDEGHKVIIWNSFIHNMMLFQNNLLADKKVHVINGTTPKDSTEPGNRDDIIKKFKEDDEPQILVTSAASLGESVSLHKNSKGETVCNHAIYLDRNFNGAQYMQSMDRIHRIGMKPDAQVEYHIILAKNTIDEVINARLDSKWRDMLVALDDDMLDGLNIDPTPEKLNDDEFNLDYQHIIQQMKKNIENK
jgi:SNF2 family DNA or RNA helicase